MDVSGSLKPPLGLAIHWREAEDSEAGVLLVMVYYKRDKAKSVKGKTHEARSRGNAQTLLPLQPHSVHQVPPASVAMTLVKCCPPGKVAGDSMSRVFTGGCSDRRPLPSLNQNSKLPEGKQVFNMNHIGCTDRLDTVPYQFLEW